MNSNCQIRAGEHSSSCGIVLPIQRRDDVGGRVLWRAQAQQKSPQLAASSPGAKVRVRRTVMNEESRAKDGRVETSWTRRKNDRNALDLGIGSVAIDNHLREQCEMAR